MNELEQLLSIITKLESIGNGSPAAVMADVSQWLYDDAPKMRGLVESAMQYTQEILEYNADMERPHLQAKLNAEHEKSIEMGLTA